MSAHAPGQIRPESLLSSIDIERIRASLARERAQNAPVLEEERQRVAAEKGRHRKESLGRIAIAEVKGFVGRFFRPLGRLATAVTGVLRGKRQASEAEQVPVVTPEPARSKFDLTDADHDWLLNGSPRSSETKAPRRVNAAIIMARLCTPGELAQINAANEAAARGRLRDDPTIGLYTETELVVIENAVAATYGPTSSLFAGANR